MNIPEEIYEMILARLAGSVDKQQELLLQQWLSEAEQNRTLYYEVCSLWYSGKWAQGRDCIQRSSGWSKIELKKKMRKKRRVMIWSVGSVAASFLLLLGIFSFLRPQAEEVELVYNIDSRQADVMLVLASGEQLEISKRIDQEILEEGVVIRSDSAYLEYKNDIKSESTEVLYNELIVPQCGEYRLRLSDGTLVILNSESRLRFPVNFKGDTREVFLIGEACFDVAKNVNRPFIVHTDHADVKVLGTLFNVSVYPDEDHTEITLVNGSVQVLSGDVQNWLIPGQQLSLNNQTLEQTVCHVDADIYTAWTNGLFRFDAMPLEQLMLRLSRWIPLSYKFKDEALKQIRFTGGFKKYDSVDHIFKMIGEIMNVSFKIENQVIIIDRR